MPRAEAGRPPNVRADAVNAALLTWLDAAGAAERQEPVFAYLHYMDPHSPYLPPESFRTRIGLPEARPGEALDANRMLTALELWQLDERQVALLESLYDAEVAALDAALRRLFAALEERGFLEDAVVLFVADHGEEFREHGMLLHGLSLHEQAVRVPLLLLAPGFAGGEVVPRNVSLLDVAPTILELAGAGREGRFSGSSLVPLLRPEGRAARLADAGPTADLILELQAKREGSMDLRSHAAAIVRGERKVLVGPDGQITSYDLARDPAEQAPRVGGTSQEDARLVDALRRARAQLAEEASGAERHELDEETREALRELGYAP